MTIRLFLVLPWLSRHNGMNQEQGLKSLNWKKKVIKSRWSILLLMLSLKHQWIRMNQTTVLQVCHMNMADKATRIHKTDHGWCAVECGNSFIFPCHYACANSCKWLEKDFAHVFRNEVDERCTLVMHWNCTHCHGQCFCAWWANKALLLLRGWVRGQKSKEFAEGANYWISNNSPVLCSICGQLLGHNWSTRKMKCFLCKVGLVVWWQRALKSSLFGSRIRAVMLWKRSECPIIRWNHFSSRSSTLLYTTLQVWPMYVPCHQNERTFLSRCTSEIDDHVQIKGSN